MPAAKIFFSSAFIGSAPTLGASQKHENAEQVPSMTFVKRHFLRGITAGVPRRLRTVGTTTFDDVATRKRSVGCALSARLAAGRAVLTREDCPHIRAGNKARVRSATFRCGRQGCGSRLQLLRSGGEMFLAGDPPEAYREIPETASRE